MVSFQSVMYCSVQIKRFFYFSSECANLMIIKLFYIITGSCQTSIYLYTLGHGVLINSFSYLLHVHYYRGQLNKKTCQKYKSNLLLLYSLTLLSYLTTYSLLSAMHELSLLLNLQVYIK